MWIWLVVQLASAAGAPAVTVTADLVVLVRADDVVVQVRPDDIVSVT